MPQNKEFGLRSTFRTVILLLMVRRIPCPTSIGVVLAVESSTAPPKERCAGAVCKTLLTIIRDVFRSQEKKDTVAKKAGYSWPESKPRRENQRTDRLDQRNCPGRRHGTRFHLRVRKFTAKTAENCCYPLSSLQSQKKKKYSDPAISRIASSGYF